MDELKIRWVRAQSEDLVDDDIMRKACAVHTFAPGSYLPVVPLADVDQLIGELVRLAQAVPHCGQASCHAECPYYLALHVLASATVAEWRTREEAKKSKAILKELLDGNRRVVKEWLE